ncbi:hypothetical protein BDV98DRAFT_569830 [Pterulicium gracile]|uniref:Uncharacterized protein n=1 Tax=Pterulicium gracile TaxID=1884261 RepID=A0A5C3QD53_9AGAR|nr:hypothetical protein BDV98DRAFT_569830 [Pterula gracilis]
MSASAPVTNFRARAPVFHFFLPTPSWLQPLLSLSMLSRALHRRSTLSGLVALCSSRCRCGAIPNALLYSI